MTDYRITYSACRIDFGAGLNYTRIQNNKANPESIMPYCPLPTLPWR